MSCDVTRLRILFCLVILFSGFYHDSLQAVEVKSVWDVRGKYFACGKQERIVSLAPNITEILFFVGANDRLKGVTKYCNYPEEASRIERIGGIFDPDVEKIISLEPGLVIATKDGNPKKVIEFLEKADIPSFVINPQNMTEIVDSMEKIACLTGASRSVHARIQTLRDDLSRLRVDKKKSDVRVLFLLSTHPLIGAGRGTFIDEMIGMVGGVNVLKGYSFNYPRLGIENILSLSPHVIFWVTSMGKSTMGKSTMGESTMGERSTADPLERVREISGNRDMKIIPVDPDVYTRPGPRLFNGLGELQNIIDRMNR